MYLTRTSSLLVAGLSCATYTKLAAAETIVIEAADTYFKPSSVNASAGDVLEFHFLPHNHSVVMGDMNNPCQPASTGGFYSGFLPASSGENTQVFQVNINDTNPFVYYCSQNASGHDHCQAGMIGFVNEANQTAISAYTSGASNAASNVSPDQGPFGGILAANTNASSTANGTSTTSGTGTAPSATSSGTSSASGSTGSAPLNNAAASGCLVAGSSLVASLMALLVLVF